MTHIPRPIRWLATVAAGLMIGGTGTFVLTGPASAQQDLPSVTVGGDCEQVTLVFENPTAFAFSGDYRVDGEAGTTDEWSGQEVAEGPHAGEPFGDRYQQVDLPPGATETVTVQFDSWSGEHLVEAVIRRGAEQQWYVPWQSLAVDCGELPDELGQWAFDCDALTATIDNPSEESLALTFAPSVGDPVDVQVAGGDSATVEFPASPGLTVEIRIGGEPVQVGKPIEITAAAWAERGCNGDKEEDGEGGGLAATGMSTGLIAGGAVALLALGTGLYLVARRRRVTFTP